MHPFIVAVASGLILAGLAEPPGVVSGVLTCTVEGGIPEDGSRDMRCVFRTSRSIEETYLGKIQTSGRDPAVSQDQMVIMWEVITPGDRLKRRSLSGRFVHTPQPGRMLLFKETDTSVVLKPISNHQEPEIGETPTTTTIVDLALSGTEA
jgi:hypothetical protein